jgi:hypothetical protein
VAASDTLRSLRPYAIGLLVGVGAIVALWVIFGGSQSSLSADPGIPPPEYVYLDNGHVLAYLSQIEGGLSTNEKVSEQLTKQQSGGISASGVSLGGSVSQEQFVERVVTPTATTRFYRLLDRLAAKSYLHTVDLADGLPTVAAKLRNVPEGDFVRLRNCRFVLPSYAQLALDIRRAHGAWTPSILPAVRREDALFDARQAAYPPPPNKVVLAPPAVLELQRLSAAKMHRAAARYVAALGEDPRVPAASCTGGNARLMRGLDLMLPIQLGALNDDPSVLAGPVTVVGKLLRSVRNKNEVYVDDRALSTWYEPVSTMDDVLRADLGEAYPTEMFGQLNSDVSVFSPGAVILPIAIYK